MTSQKGKWIDTNGNAPSWTNWSVGQPNNYQTGQDYAAITFINKWSDYSDWAMVNIVCQQTLSKGVETTSAPSTTTTSGKRANKFAGGSIFKNVNWVNCLGRVSKLYF